MKRSPLRWMSSQVHLALGLAALTVSIVLLAGYLGLIPDREAMTRKHRAALAETIAVAASGLLDDAQPQALHETLEFIRGRNPELLSIGVRDSHGELLIDVAQHAEHWTPGEHTVSNDGEVVVPVWQAGQPWGRIELRFESLRAPGFIGHLQDPSLQLAAFLFAAGAITFYFYLKRMLRQLDPSRAVPARVRTAYDTLAEGLLVIDGQGRIVLANKATGAMLGVAESALIGHSPSSFPWTDPTGTPLNAAALPWQIAIDEHEPQRDAYLHACSATGQRYSLRANCSPIVDERGNLQAVVVSFQDVTELERKGEALRAAKEEAVSANQAKSRFLANMSHEIRTPMNAILGFTEVLRRGGLRNADEAARQLGIIHSSGRHLLNLINDILDLSKVEAGRFETERMDFAPHKVTREVVQTLRVRAEERRLALELEFAEPLPATVTADPARLRQILTNLIGNALKFTERGAVRVGLRLERDARRYCIDVIDSGIGIAAENLEAVFEPFVQAESSTARRFGGTGLGLTISRGFARAMGGDITVNSVLGQGTTFTLWLPAGSAALLEPAQLRADSAAIDVPQTAQWRLPDKHVLVVDDGAENRELARVVLEEAGLRVSEADNGQVAIDRIAAETFDLVLMDMQMPVLDGLTATRRLRDAGCTLPIVALTANAMKGFERELDAAGFSGFLTKPIDIDRLLAELARRLGGERVEKVRPVASPAAAAPDIVADVQPIVSRLAAHPKLGRIVARFADKLPEKLGEMDSALEGGDMQVLAGLAHWLKGAGGSMGFDELVEPSKSLEVAAKSADAAAAAQALLDVHHLQRRIHAGRGPATQQLEEVAS